MQKLPTDFINRIKNQLGDEADDFFESFNKPYTKSLRINLRKNQEGIISRGGNGLLKLDDLDFANRVAWEKSGIYYHESDDEDIFDASVALSAPGKSPLHAAGAYYIQEASAMLPVTLLELESENRKLKVLDLCAAPGGKTTQIADKMMGKGLLVCNEIVSQRAKILSENIERMGVTNAIVVSEDPDKLAAKFPFYFDYILVDAPCSGEGMFRKHPKAMDEWSLDNVTMCAARQENILDAAAKMLRPGGKIVYSTCTFSEEEDEESAEKFLQRNPNFKLDWKYCRLFPHRDKGEGHFATRFVFGDSLQITKATKETEAKKKKKNDYSPTKQQIDSFISFCKENLLYCDILSVPEGSGFESAFDDNIMSRFYMFGERLYLAPEIMPSIAGLTVLRCGLCLGNFVKNRFEPDHAFALALTCDEVRNHISYSCDDSKAMNYLRGYTDNVSQGKGWCLVCVEGMSLGWGKIANNILKNHYPKGLRVVGN